jgi:hypothetical protein
VIALAVRDADAYMHRHVSVGAGVCVFVCVCFTTATFGECCVLRVFEPLRCGWVKTAFAPGGRTSRGVSMSRRL